ncbi:MAG TPA: hypothetical protein VGE98_14820 [Thermoanaerobaculia bacterium]
MKKVTSRKLALSKESLRLLDDRLPDIAGGLTTNTQTAGATCHGTCHNTQTICIC